LSRFHRFAFTVLPGSPRATAAVFAAFRASLERSPRLAAQLATLRAGARDKALLARPEIARWLLGSFREGLRRSVAGPVCDLQLFSRSWGVDLGAIRAPAHLWIGTADTAVPVGAARLLARSIAACAVTELPADGISGWRRTTATFSSGLRKRRALATRRVDHIAGRDKT
jgi:pimeloyl-ACP methyl ester carboxylesterase